MAAWTICIVVTKGIRNKVKLNKRHKFSKVFRNPTTSVKQKAFVVRDHRKTDDFPSGSEFMNVSARGHEWTVL